jgi:prevent-host-death family protein
MPDGNHPLIPLAEAKAHISSLVAQVEAGAEFVLTRHGKPVARLVPMKPTIDRKPGVFTGPFWENFDRDQLVEIFRPMTDEEVREEGWE